MPCSLCRAPTVWDDNVLSDVCTECGHLADPSQTVLTSQQEFSYQPNSQTLRARNNWTLSGQAKQARDTRNSYAIAELINSLAVSLSATGLSPRAITLFTQAKSLSNFRWGQKSTIVAGACFAIALRESNRPDAISDIASILNITTTALTRQFIMTCSSLNLSFDTLDPSIHIPAIHTHLTTLLSHSSSHSTLPASLVQSLRSTPLRPVANTATSLCRLLIRLSPEHQILRLPLRPTASAIFILAFEAENKAPCNHLGPLAQLLGSLCESGKSVVMSRYKTLQDELAIWIQNVPWLDKYNSKNGRAKVSKRTIVSRGLKEVINFQDELWQNVARLQPNLELAGDEGEEVPSQPLDSERPAKRQKLSRPLADANSFLLNPLGSSFTSDSTSKQLKCESMANSFPNDRFSLGIYTLTTDSAPTHHAPSRLQLLALDRGGASDKHIADDELFAPGEFELMLRNDVEQQQLQQILGWDKEDASQDNVNNKRSAAAPKARPSECASKPEGEPPAKKSRINMEALARFLAGERDQTAEEEEMFVESAMLGLEEFAIDGEEADRSVLVEDSFDGPPRKRRVQNTTEDFDEEIVGEADDDTTDLHPFGGDDFDSRYEQEYD
ncbi:hypothetical protein CVT24_000842 [Panaeolus cyanescens]|uniref:TFIIB-type domain-containing protein n=1 Tax=Panaeolus cyanescens TaxID=181874 RepID=A0A409VVK6_9AGAR|nr:hypothetical protein CVT24_000842 [Panaeolus cyanescens]